MGPGRRHPRIGAGGRFSSSWRKVWLRKVSSSLEVYYAEFLELRVVTWNTVLDHANNCLESIHTLIVPPAKMSRRPPSDNFTRFTSTSPHASSKPSAASNFSYQPPTNSPFNAASRSDETPQEKVARLRAAARAAKVKQSMSLVDRMIDRGRVWADISHRVVTYGLIGFTGISILPLLSRPRVLP